LVLDLHIRLWIPSPLVRLGIWPAILYRLLRYGYTFRRIRLTNGMYAIVDPEDFDWLNKYKWHCKPSSTNLYAVTTVTRNNVRVKLYMHRLVMEYKLSPEYSLSQRSDLSRRSETKTEAKTDILTLIFRLFYSCFKRRLTINAADTSVATVTTL
jgi:hypothetical protein